MAATPQQSAPSVSNVKEETSETTDVGPSESPATTVPGNESQRQASETTASEDLGLPKSAADGLIKKPFPHPAEGAKPDPAPELSPDQIKRYEDALKTVSAWTTVPSSSAKNAAEVPITDDDRIFMTRECLLRYLRATKWNVADAVKRIRATLLWRREYIGNKLTPDYISIENETGKQLILGYDVSGRPCLYLIPSRQNTEKSPRQIEHLVFMLERLIDLMPPGQETLALLVNFNDTKSGQNASIGQARQTLDFLQTHYPERLGRAIVKNLPWIIWGFFKIITPFIDPVTVQKLKFNEDLRQLVPPEQLSKETGGDVQFEYDHSVYWPTLNKLAEQRRKAYTERWVNAGKRIGESEVYLRGGAEKSRFGSDIQAPSDELEEKMDGLKVDSSRPTEPTASS